MKINCLFVINGFLKSEKFNELYQMLENAAIKYDINLIREESSVRGEFVRQVLNEYSEESEEFINRVIEKGMKYL